MVFFIFHGSFGSPEENWFPELREQLEAIGQKVYSPQFPTEDYEEMTRTGMTYSPKKQTLDNWLEFFRRNYLDKLKGEKLCFIAHSVGPVFILHLVEKFGIELDSAIFVSPFLDLNPGLWQYRAVNSSFMNGRHDFKKLKKLIPVSYVLYSDSDPYVPKEKPPEFASKIGGSVIMVRNAGHLNRESNFTKFPLVFELCKTRLDPTTYL